ncbi:hypothetical protein FJSC11DRAFT_0839 [Fischerella thermalis JSC-11]|uniref:Uncharacterized protein n=1 Tax=Fischerella thermalis JSC-11 TaxID=741277 RepID=G6FPQ9_9CYAN|nr:hypothetical protein [Fischerella thermalis]EHC18859.1 hypothetical protein FJSC11DRAFT_0839 [Fischerella thermalis JSC-11]
MILVIEKVAILHSDLGRQYIEEIRNGLNQREIFMLGYLIPYLVFP